MAGSQMIIDHPGLAASAPPGGGAGSRIAALLAAGLILPVLDGLDEIPDAVRGPAITRINDALRPGEPLVVTCRTGAFRDAIRPSAGAAVTLRAAAGVELCPLDAAAVARYLRDDAGMPAAARWDPVIARLGTPAPAGQALTTPLMVGLARTIYNPRPGEHAGALRDPAELCESALPGRAAVEQHLFDAFIPAAYRDKGGPGGRCRWPARKAEAWLVFTARHLERAVDSPDFAWWQLQQALPPAVSGVAAGGAAGLAVGLAAGLGAGLVVGLAAGSAAAVAAGLALGHAAARWRRPEPSRGTRWRLSIRSLVLVLAVGFAAGLAAGLTFGLSSFISHGFAAGLAAGLGPGLSVGLGVGLAVGLAAAKWGGSATRSHRRREPPCGACPRSPGGACRGAHGWSRRRVRVRDRVPALVRACRRGRVRAGLRARCQHAQNGMAVVRACPGVARAAPPAPLVADGLSG
ncbi:MAG TPA: hypothetical protein VMV92_34165 [Streptosporangiaceae bacterium]|nr:hypothetical protein [Streptosporangiaceae bacterium]